jgi:hypothetical protein
VSTEFVVTPYRAPGAPEPAPINIVRRPGLVQRAWAALTPRYPRLARWCLLGAALSTHFALSLTFDKVHVIGPILDWTLLPHFFGTAYVTVANGLGDD